MQDHTNRTLSRSILAQASFDEIKTTYRRLALEFHPDQARGGMDDQEVTTIFSKVAQVGLSRGHGLCVCALSDPACVVGAVGVVAFLYF